MSAHSAPGPRAAGCVWESWANPDSGWLTPSGWVESGIPLCFLQGCSPGLSSAELCRPMLVCPLEGPQGVRGRECFLRVTSGHLFEVELQAARTLARLELQSLEAAEVEPESEAALEVSASAGGSWKRGWACRWSPLGRQLLGAGRWVASFPQCLAGTWSRAGEPRGAKARSQTVWKAGLRSGAAELVWV